MFLPINRFRPVGVIETEMLRADHVSETETMSESWMAVAATNHDALPGRGAELVIAFMFALGEERHRVDEAQTIREHGEVSGAVNVTKAHGQVITD